MKRFTLLLAFVSCFFMRLYAYDFSQETTEGQFRVTLYYAINPDGESVTIVQGPEKYAFVGVVIPETVIHDGKTYTVTTIGASAFESCDIGMVEMPNSITEIMSSAFRKSLVDSVRFSRGLKHIRSNAFEASTLSRVELYEGLETIGDKAFNAYVGVGAGTQALRYIHIPNSVYEIGASAFNQQGKLVYVRLPEGLKEIKRTTFNMCRSLSSITLPKDLETIGDNAFAASGLMDLEIPGMVRTIGSRAFNGTPLSTVTIPDNVESLGESAFSACENLTSIAFSKGMKSIPSFVCSGCVQLVDVRIPDGVEEVGSYAFQTCTLLSTVKFPESIKKMEQGIFYGSGIVRFTFPSQITEIPQSTFLSCENIAEFTVPEHITSIDDRAFEDCSNLGKIMLHDGIVNISAGVFRDCVSLQDVVIPKGIKTISGEMFKSCTDLRRVVLPDSLIGIGANAFQYCSVLTDIEFPKTLENIALYAFNGCAALEIITIPHSVENIGIYVFTGCVNLKELHMQKAVPLGNGIIDTDNNCTLYVPRGAKAAYEASPSWNQFKEIVEEDVPDVYYSIVASRKKGRGTETVDDVNVSQVKELIAGSELTVMFAASEGYVIERILCNGEEIGSEAYGKQLYEYAIEAVETNYVFEVYYKEAPVVLKLKSGNGGSIDVMVEKGSTFTCNIVAEEGWIVNCVKFNYSDVTSKVADDGGYTTPVITGTSTLSIAFEQTDGIESAVASNVKVYSLNDESIVVEGVENHNAIRVYATGGALLKEIPAAESYEVITLPTGDIYVVEACGKVMKIAL